MAVYLSKMAATMVGPNRQDAYVSVYVTFKLYCPVTSLIVSFTRSRITLIASHWF